MADDRVAGLKIYSLGIVVQPKVRGSDIIMVSPIEALPMDSGPIKADSKNIKVSLPDQKGVVKNTEIKGGSTIKAKWIPYGDSNRESAPDVQPSETVLIFSYANTQDFYWTTIFREPTLRRLETVRRMYSNQPSGLTPYDDDTAYWTEVSTHDKRMLLQTAINDGEKALYQVEINGGEGFFLLTDDFKNYLRIDSPDILVQLVNGENTYIREDKDKLYTGANKFICETSPVIYLNALNVVAGMTGCGVDMGDESVYHDRPFMMVSQESSQARIGNGYSAYTHYDGPDVNTVGTSTITEQTTTKKTEASSEINESTQTKNTSAALAVVTATKLAHTIASDQILSDTSKFDVNASEEISLNTNSLRMNSPGTIAMNTAKFEVNAGTSIDLKTSEMTLHATESITTDTKVLHTAATQEIIEDTPTYHITASKEIIAEAGDYKLNATGVNEQKSASTKIDANGDLFLTGKNASFGGGSTADIVASEVSLTGTAKTTIGGGGELNATATTVINNTAPTIAMNATAAITGTADAVELTTKSFKLVPPSDGGAHLSVLDVKIEATSLEIDASTARLWLGQTGEIKAVALDIATTVGAINLTANESSGEIKSSGWISKNTFWSMNYEAMYIVATVEKYFWFKGGDNSAVHLDAQHTAITNDGGDFSQSADTTTLRGASSLTLNSPNVVINGENYEAMQARLKSEILLEVSAMIAAAAPPPAPTPLP